MRHALPQVKDILPSRRLAALRLRIGQILHRHCAACCNLDGLGPLHGQIDRPTHDPRKDSRITPNARRKLAMRDFSIFQMKAKFFHGPEIA